MTLRRFRAGLLILFYAVDGSTFVGFGAEDLASSEDGPTCQYTTIDMPFDAPRV
jgi:hypothetical protein